ncbi:Ig-like domain-containing protein [Hymenobacter sp. H14-R3]|uniref:Ig-like domain-containing protein n=1 Tax=Hymenobacter sp. H14-R3 TaxID=3046308 RepID=UPI0024BB414E|nr:T9SS type A sorting domain-containing protein [Hymenobacter sp. H14-R3]MDJ0365539.1 Ig-like domain-containing protein [Hymenobacter sp. H14-R3]
MNTCLPLCKKVAGRLSKAGRALALLAAMGLPTLAPAQTIIFPRKAPFDGINPSDFTLGGNAFLTATGNSAANGTPSGTPIDATGKGVLRLTNAVLEQAGYAIDNNTFATPNGFSISFEFFSYGTTTDEPADGFTIFLVDGAGTEPTNGFKIGGFGGSLGYAQRQTSPTVTEPGVTKGYLGIGIDEYGNFGIASEGKSGGYPGQTALLKNAVTLRGPYNSADPTRYTGYAYLTGSNSLPFDLAVGTSKTNKGSRIVEPTDAGYRKAYINVIPVVTNGVTTYRITVRIQNGQSVATAVNNFTIVSPPSTLRVGFGASTGGRNGIHEIRGLEIVKAPIAVDDNAQTRYNQPTTIGVLDNDLDGDGAAIDPATVDLNPNTVPREVSYTVDGKGTFSVDDKGVVTFTPSGTFSGVVSTPYTIRNFNSDLSNPGTINVTVTGADVQTVMSGSATVNPGTTTSYSVTTTNNGVETATNIIPTLTLPATGATYVSGGTQSGSTVSFPQVTLAAGQSVTNSVIITWLTADSYVLTSNYAYPSGAVVPDAVAANNSSTLTVTVQGSANIAGVCAVPGKDGPMTLTATSQPNVYYPGITAASGSKTITVGTTPTGNTATPIAAGDMLLIMQMQGATMSTVNNNTYGTVSGTPTAGTYEYAVAASSVDGSGNLTLAAKLTSTYTANATGNTFQVIRIPQYSALTLSGTVTGTAWDGSTGGVLALEVAGATTFNTGAGLNMDGKGFRGGAAVKNTSNGPNTDYVSTASASHSSKGESIGGSPFQVYSNSVASSGGPQTYQDYAGGSYARGQATTGGGGGNRVGGYAPGGGGGANGGTGGQGQGDGNGTNVTTSLGGDGGVATSSVTPASLYLGGGGGAGVNNTNTFLPSGGGTGGGIIILRTGTASGTATVSASGFSGQAIITGGGGGGGAGGTVVLKAASLTTLTANASGGDGGDSNSNGNGGGGGGGAVFSSSALKSTAVVTAGANGTGATEGIRNANTTIGGDCLPTLTTALRTTLPNVTRSSTMQTAYVYTVSNTGGGITGLIASPDLAKVGGTGLFTYASMSSSAVIQAADGTSKTLVAGTDYTVTGTNKPTFTLTPTLVVPSGASVVFTFAANIAATAVTGTAYGSNAATSYLNPQRTSLATTTAAPAYTSTGTSADAVTIVAPLPVQLTKFVATTSGSDAVLSWATATEVNNHHFEVERSLDATHFTSIATVAGRGTTMQAASYQYTDAGASARTTGVLYYRLRQVDTDGQSALSPVQAVRFRHSAGTLVTVFPNPTTGMATLDLSSLPAGTYTVQILEATGRLVRQYTCPAGLQPLAVESLPTGTYFVKVQGADTVAVLPLIRQ